MNHIYPINRLLSFIAVLVAIIGLGMADRAMAQIEVAGGGETNPTLRTVNVPGSSMVVRTWTQPTETGDTPYIAFSADGETFTEPRPVDYSVRLKLVTFDPTIAVPLMPERLSSVGKNGGGAAMAGAADAQPYIVQFIAPPMDFMLQPLRDLGAKPLTHVPDTSHIIEMSPATALQVTALPQVRWVGPFHPGYRAEPAIVEELLGDLNRVPTRRYSIMLFERGPAAQQIVSDRIAAFGGIVHARISEGFRLEATLTAAQLLEIIGMNQVLFVDRWGPAGTDMNIAREIGGAVPLLSGLGFTGQGVRGHVLDDGLRQTHVAFAGPVPLIYGLAPPIMTHGTNTYGIVFGNGANNAAGTGLLPNREQGVFSYYTQLAGHGGALSRYTMTKDIVDPALPYRVVFQSNSWGSASTTAYAIASAEFDDMLFLNDLLVCQSQSNNGSQLSRPEAWAKNVIGVGGVRHLNTLSRVDDSWTSASHGPAADGRVKPDLAHFYDSITTPTGSSDTAYRTDFCCTSAGTPIVCGHAGLLMQMWHEGVFEGFGGGATVFDSRPHAATARALLINSAFRYNWLAGGSNGNLTRDKQGWGMPNLETLYNARTKTFIVDQTDPVTAIAVQEYELAVGAGEPEFRATLVYPDPMGNPGAGMARINDLSLRVMSPTGTIYWGNNGLNASNFSTPGGVPNSVDTVENVFIQNPQGGTWTVTVYGHSIVEDTNPDTPLTTDAVFSLVVVPVVVGAPCPADIIPPGGDGTVGVAELLEIINDWGICPDPPPPCASDLAPDGGDGNVGVPDLLFIINNWGPCA